MPAGTLTSTSTRYAKVPSLSQNDFKDHIANKVAIINRVAAVMQEAVDEGELTPWEYNDVETMLGYTFAALFGVQPSNWSAAQQQLDQALSGRIGQGA